MQNLFTRKTYSLGKNRRRTMLKQLTELQERKTSEKCAALLRRGIRGCALTIWVFSILPLALLPTDSTAFAKLKIIVDRVSRSDHSYWELSWKIQPLWLYITASSFDRLRHARYYQLATEHWAGYQMLCLMLLLCGRGELSPSLADGITVETSALLDVKIHPPKKTRRNCPPARHRKSFLTFHATNC